MGSRSQLELAHRGLPPHVLRLMVECTQQNAKEVTLSPSATVVISFGLVLFSHADLLCPRGGALTPARQRALAAKSIVFMVHEGSSLSRARGPAEHRILNGSRSPLCP